MERIIKFVKDEIVLTVAVVLAILSAFIVPIDAQYIEYIDFRTLAILFCLMAVMVGLQDVGVFKKIAGALLSKVHSVSGVVFILVFLCFFSSMLITNDVALITFVPFTFIVLNLLGEDKRKVLVIPVVVLQTIAANLGSMLTPIGNPQNLYLYGKAGMGFAEFILLMLPYTAASFVLIGVMAFFVGRKNAGNIDSTLQEMPSLKEKRTALVRYLLLFALAIATVVHVVPYPITLGITVLMFLVFDRSLLKKVDYALLVTFVGFFVFIGNMGRIPAFYNLLQSVVEGNEILVSVVASQAISNVPAALLLSAFTTNIEGLIIGTNLGGLGTLIASMASLISYKYIAKENVCKKGQYFVAFTVANILLLIILLLFTYAFN